MQDFRTAMERGRASGNADAVISLLAEDVAFRSPVVHKPYEGRSAVEPRLRAVVQVFDDFQFTRHLTDDEDAQHGFLFRARIGNRDVEGCDFVHYNDAGEIDEFYVMVRPLSGAMALAEAMQRRLGDEAPERLV
jgi:SnoaL-like domain